LPLLSISTALTFVAASNLLPFGIDTSIFPDLPAALLLAFL